MFIHVVGVYAIVKESISKLEFFWKHWFLEYQLCYWNLLKKFSEETEEIIVEEIQCLVKLQDKGQSPC